MAKMMKFRFTPRVDGPSWKPDGLSGRSARALTADDFTFHCFHADVALDDGENVIQLRTPGLPVIDFVLMIVQMRRETASSGAAFVESSQTQDAMTAVRRDDSVEMTYSFSEKSSRVSLRDFDEMPTRALHAALPVLHSVHGELRNNRYLIALPGLVRSD
ncbi:hypothetical protein [Streptomyces longispororuber]|uniref:hypothetical protein n=1 Tax=Streptomyces longispororuber TaxID=68230 RepID=UPI0036FE5171